MDIIDDVEKRFAISHRYSLPNQFETNSQNENLFFLFLSHAQIPHILFSFKKREAKLGSLATESTYKKKSLSTLFSA